MGRETSALLEVTDYTVAYATGGTALRRATLDVRKGEIVALLGPNGSGKSTLIRGVCGTLPYYRGRPLAGQIRLQSEDITGMSPTAIVERGLVQVPEGRRILPQLTVEENLRAGLIGAGKPQRAEKELGQIFAMFPVLSDRRKGRAGYLSGGEQQMLAIGRAMCADPSLLVLDEPMLGLAPKVVARVLDVIVSLNEAGVGILLVEQNVTAALDVADRAYVLRLGEMLAGGSREQIKGSDELTRAYIGIGGANSETRSPPDARVNTQEEGSTPTKLALTAHERDDRRETEASVTPRLVARDVSVNFGALQALKDVSVSVAEGQLSAIVGPNGAGKSTLLNCITGVAKFSGTILLDGEPIAGVDTTSIARRGVARAFQHTVAPGGMTAGALVSLGVRREHLTPQSRTRFRKRKDQERQTREIVNHRLNDFGLGDYLNTPISQCPYGVQKRLDIARALVADPSLLLLDEPFAGLPDEEASDVFDLIRGAMSLKSLSVLLIDHNVEMVFSNVEHVTVLDFGCVIADGLPAEVRADPLVQEAYFGSREEMRHSE